MIRTAVKELEALGKFPISEKAQQNTLRQQETILAGIERPLSPEEARVLVRLFGPDTYYGLAWTLLHLIETTPGWPIEACVASMDSGPWQDRIRMRASKAAT
jgi:hypothetical protein